MALQINQSASASSASSPDGAAFPLLTAVAPYASGVSALANSAVGSTGSISATLASSPGATVYLTGFQVTAGGATAGGSALVTVTGLLGGTQSFTMTWGVVATGGLPPPLIVQFSPALPASAVNTNIVVTFPGQGAGGLNEAVSAQGYLI